MSGFDVDTEHGPVLTGEAPSCTWGPEGSWRGRWARRGEAAVGCPEGATREPGGAVSASLSGTDGTCASRLLASGAASVFAPSAFTVCALHAAGAFA